jgi:hypothetical protein
MMDTEAVFERSYFYSESMGLIAKQDFIAFSRRENVRYNFVQEVLVGDNIHSHARKSNMKSFIFLMKERNGLNMVQTAAATKAGLAQRRVYHLEYCDNVAMARRWNVTQYGASHGGGRDPVQYIWAHSHYSFIGNI